MFTVAQMGYKDKEDLSIHVRKYDDRFGFSTRYRNPAKKVARGFGATLFLLAFIVFFRDSFFNSKLEFAFVSIPIRAERYPVTSNIPLPKGARKLPKIQHEPVFETLTEKRIRQRRLKEVKKAFLHAWGGYKKEAWARDELRPVNGGFKTPFCGWAASLVDALDTLWIMELYDEFELALAELKDIIFTHKENCQINLFETTIRHLGGMLAAWDLSGGKYPILIEKSVELAEVLYTAFDTENRMPTAFFTWSAVDPDANDHLPSRSVPLAVIGSLSLEFTRLAQITGNAKYFDAIQRVMNELEKWQGITGLPGMWPAMVDSSLINETLALGSPYRGSSELYTLGALADSTYEYLPKQYMILGGKSPSYKAMYDKFIAVAKEELFFRPMTMGEEDILIAGAVNRIVGEPAIFNPEIQHLACFTGGMVAIAGKIFNRPEEVDMGSKLADGCIWAYKTTLSGIMPETSTAVPCKSKMTCKWDQEAWMTAIDPEANETTIREQVALQKLAPGFTRIQDERYLLRPEAIESVFIMHRITADPYWANSGWNMFKSIMAHTETDLAHSAIDHVMEAFPTKTDGMESFWLAETLKYFYLLYSESNVVDLDEYVLNTEAHPLRRPK